MLRTLTAITASLALLCPSSANAGEVHDALEAYALYQNDVSTLLDVDIENAAAGPWDKGRVPVERVQARAAFDGTNWDIENATLRAGSGNMELLASRGVRVSKVPWASSAK